MTSRDISDENQMRSQQVNQLATRIEYLKREEQKKQLRME
jgi:hypothetical protein